MANRHAYLVRHSDQPQRPGKWKHCGLFAAGPGNDRADRGLAPRKRKAGKGIIHARKDVVETRHRVKQCSASKFKRKPKILMVCGAILPPYVCPHGTFPTVIIGYVGWAAGNFYPTYVLGETPTQSGSTWTDTALVQACLSPKTNKLIA